MSRCSAGLDASKDTLGPFAHDEVTENVILSYLWSTVAAAPLDQADHADFPPIRLTHHCVDHHRRAHGADTCPRPDPCPWSLPTPHGRATIAVERR